MESVNSDGARRAQGSSDVAGNAEEQGESCNSRSGRRERCASKPNGRLTRTP
jgi:hypothetical protein